MLFLDSHRIRTLVPISRVIDCLRETFCSDVTVPLRQVVSVPGAPGRLFVSMPAFDGEGGGAVKLATVFPDAGDINLPTVQAVIVVFSARGTPLALLDGAIVTQLRTAAASALASTYLSRADSAHLVIIGTGALAPTMAVAHCAVRPISRISVCGRNRSRAEVTAAAIRSLVERNIEVRVPESTESAVASADIVSCATSSPTPVLLGRWLRPGTFVDLVGSFSPRTRESDDEVVARSQLFVDTYEGTLAEAGDLLVPLAAGVITRERLEGELADLVRGRSLGRRSADAITLFKSVGTAIEDLAASQLIVKAASLDLDLWNSGGVVGCSQFR